MDNSFQWQLSACASMHHGHCEDVIRWWSSSESVHPEPRPRRPTGETSSISWGKSQKGFHGHATVCLHVASWGKPGLSPGRQLAKTCLTIEMIPCPMPPELESAAGRAVPLCGWTLCNLIITSILSYPISLRSSSARWMSSPRLEPTFILNLVQPSDNAFRQRYRRIQRP